MIQHKQAGPFCSHWFSREVVNHPGPFVGLDYGHMAIYCVVLPVSKVGKYFRTAVIELFVGFFIIFFILAEARILVGINKT